MKARESSSPGNDFINHTLLKHLLLIAFEVLLKIFNNILKEASFPQMWRNYDIVLISKPSKVDFRPIALSSCILKILEKLIKSRFERFIELDLILPISQYGFRKGRTCDDCKTLLLLEIYRGFITHNPVGVLFLDIKGAYDNVNSCMLFDIVNNLKIPSHYKNFIRNLIDHRQVNFYEKGHYYGSRILYRGLLQESTLSPILFGWAPIAHIGDSPSYSICISKIS